MLCGYHRIQSVARIVKVHGDEESGEGREEVQEKQEERQEVLIFILFIIY